LFAHTARRIHAAPHVWRPAKICAALGGQQRIEFIAIDIIEAGRLTRRRKSHGWLIALAWGLNIAGLTGVLIVIGLAMSGTTVFAADQATQTTTPVYGLVATAAPLPYYLPTITPNPLSTALEGLLASPTPFSLASGRHGQVIGFSAQGHPIEVYTFGQGEKQRLIVAGIHGGYEWNTIALADQLIAFLDEHPEAVPSDVTLFIVRDMNPDGDARGHTNIGRTNANGVDLNRNFPENWQATWNRDGCWNELPTTGGTSPGSEPETRAIMRFFEGHNIDAAISYHSAALGIFPGGTPWDADSMRLGDAIAKVASYPYPPLDTGCIYTGTLADYAVSMGAAAVDMELTNHYDTDYEMNLNVLNVFLNWQR